MRSVVLLNPFADHGRAIDLKDSILEWCSSYCETDLVITEEPDQARHLAKSYSDSGYDCVIAAGGDGTVHEVANGLVTGTQATTSLGIIPLGSGNDFAYGLGLPLQPKEGIDHLFRAGVRQIDLARIEDDRGRLKVVTNGIGIGFDAMVTIQSQRISFVHGHAMYLLAVLRTIALHYDSPRLKIQFDDNYIEQPALLLAVGVGPRIGGGFFLTPDASFNDNRLDSCTVNPVNRATMLQMLPRVMRGTHVNSRHVTMRQNQRITIEADRSLPVHIDGEIYAYPEENVRWLSITSLPSALKLAG